MIGQSLDAEYSDTLPEITAEGLLIGNAPVLVIVTDCSLVVFFGLLPKGIDVALTAKVGVPVAVTAKVYVKDCPC